MTPKLSGMERRLHPRISQRLALNIAANGYDFSTTTANISCVGAYCRVDKYIPPFTKIITSLALPSNKKRKASDCKIECKGVVVRTQDEKEGGFNIAIFFNEIKEAQKQRISQYLNDFLKQPSACL